MSLSPWVYYVTTLCKIAAPTFPSSSCCWSPLCPALIFLFFHSIYQFPACYRLYLFLMSTIYCWFSCLSSTPLPDLRVLCCVINLWVQVVHGRHSIFAKWINSYSVGTAEKACGCLMLPFSMLCPLVNYLMSLKNDKKFKGEELNEWVTMFVKHKKRKKVK